MAVNCPNISANSIPVLCQETISQDEEVQYLSTTAPELWSVKKGRAPSPRKINGHSPLNGPVGLETEAPSCIFSAVPPDQECLKESDK